MLWSVLQQIAEYLHKENIDELITELVDIFKYQAGLLNEFGDNSFRFIHRTFQEYLAAKNIIIRYGIEQSENMIYDSIHNKINIPN
ncbi:unnamed protein product [Rotaria sp. Silwood1]|nr:unnamed protein product [Rotaria sp. Silwood1]